MTYAVFEMPLASVRVRADDWFVCVCVCWQDEVNRKISHDMLLKEALSRNCQFVFISPLTIDTQDNRRITVHR